MSQIFFEDIATGTGELKEKLAIGGRPRQGCKEAYVLLEEPGVLVQMHWINTLVPHLKKNCPHCNGTNEPKPFWYVGAFIHGSRGETCILELNAKCFYSAQAAAKNEPGPTTLNLEGEIEPTKPVFTGLLVEIRRADFRNSPRVLRFMQRVEVRNPWPFNTKKELARIWGIPIRPTIYKERSG